ncbi:MAG TPA: hypothetical protein VIY48_18495 [Candidatus Paceibacterota bacterium]
MSEDTSRVDEDLVDDEDLDDTEETEDGAGEEDELSLASLKKQFDDMASQQKELLAEREELRKRLVKANAEAKKYRLRSKGVKPAPAVKEDDADDDSDAKPVANNDSRNEVEKLQTRLMVESVKAGLLEAGVKGRQRAAKLAKLVDLDALDYDSYGGVDGLDEQIDQLKEDFPQLFADDEPVEEERRKPVAPARKPVTADRSRRADSGRSASTAERLAKSLNRR